MAKDGTSRGGAQIGAGRKRGSLGEKIANGNPGHRKLEVLDLSETSQELEGFEMPPVKDFLKDEQKNGISLCAEEVYKDTYRWLASIHCEKLVSQQMVEQYAMSVARWVQCEKAISSFGLLSRHPTTSSAIQSPFVTMAQSYLKQVNQTWYQIFQIVRENCMVPYKPQSPQDDLMERLLTQQHI